jgi:hypothetical protein
VGGLDGGDEELGAVGAWAGVGHGQEVWAVMLVGKFIVLKKTINLKIKNFFITIIFF